MKKVLVFPCSRLLASGRPNPKNYTLMADVVRVLRDRGVYCIQGGLSEEHSVGCDERRQDQNIATILQLTFEVDAFLCVDTFLPHLVMANRGKYDGKPDGLLRGVVVWIVTDHHHFGYEAFTNIYSSKPTLAPNMLAAMEGVAEEMKAMTKNAPPHDRVAEAVLNLLG